MNNPVYGKTMQKLRKEINVKLVSNKKTTQNGQPTQAISLTKYLTVIQLQYVKKSYSNT